MKKYVKEFLHRGLMFGGFGPIILGVIYAILEKFIEDFSLNGVQLLIAIVSVYLLAFLQAGASVFNRIESWSLPKSLFFHLLTLYAAYLACYIVNSWLPFDAMNIVWFTVIFLVIYAVVWLTVYFSIKATSKKLNKSLK